MQTARVSWSCGCHAPRLLSSSSRRSTMLSQCDAKAEEKKGERPDPTPYDKSWSRRNTYPWVVFDDSHPILHHSYTSLRVRTPARLDTCAGQGLFIALVHSRTALLLLDVQYLR
jgi:hypothetical protein